MNFLKHIMVFSVFSFLMTGCGGGDSSITGDAGNSDTPPADTTGSTTLRWTAPSTRSDSSTVSLSEISGYRLYYGPSATVTPDYIDIQDGSTMQYTIILPTGNYFFRISAIDASGAEGLLSAAIQKSI